MTVLAIKDIVLQRMQNAANRHLPAENSLWLQRPAGSLPTVRFYRCDVVSQATHFTGSWALPGPCERHTAESQVIQTTTVIIYRSTHGSKPLYGSICLASFKRVLVWVTGLWTVLASWWLSWMWVQFVYPHLPYFIPYHKDHTGHECSVMFDSLWPHGL